MYIVQNRRGSDWVIPSYERRSARGSFTRVTNRSQLPVFPWSSSQALTNSYVLGVQHGSKLL